MPRYKNPGYVTVGTDTYTFHPDVLEALPEARAFILGLLAGGGISKATATRYVKIVARLRQQGRLHDPKLITDVNEHTAANAFHRWRADSYYVTVQPVQNAFAFWELDDAVMWLRVGSILPPRDGKIVPRPAPPWQQGGTAITWEVSTAWTLHVPMAPSPPHADPCERCRVIDLTPALLEVLATAFERVWGHRDISAVSPDAYLFGEPPLAEILKKRSERSEKIVALVPAGTSADDLNRIGANVVGDIEAFSARLREGAEAVYISRTMCGAQLHEVLKTIEATWTS